MSATSEPSRHGGTRLEGWSLDHCEAEVAHLYKVLHRYRSLTEDSGWAQFDGRARTHDDRDKRLTGARDRSQAQHP